MQKFITFEGGEGSGKSTQIAKLAEYLKSRGDEVLVTREPGGSKRAEKIRTLLLDSNNDWDSLTELFLLLAARNDHINEVILPALQKGSWVLCDRFHFSTIAYQAYGGGLNIQLVEELSHPILQKALPVAVILLDIEPEIGLQRAQSRSESLTRFDSKDIDYHKSVRHGFLELAKENSINCFTIAGDNNINAIFKQILQALQKIKHDIL